jgi:antitoxin VapB
VPGRSTQTRRAEVEAKLAAVRGWLDERGLPGVVLTQAGPVAWLSGGVTNPVDRGEPTSPLWLVVTPDRAGAVTTAVELPRLRAESALEELGFPLEAVPWYDGGALLDAAETVAEAPRAALASDRGGGFGTDADDDLTALRLRLTEPERDRLAALGRNAAAALERAVRAWRPGELDLDVQARVADELERVGAIPVCLIVGGDERMERFRHPLAAGMPVERLLMAVVVAMRGGLHVAATRCACVGSPPAAFDAALAVEAAMLDAGPPGATYGDVVAACANAYAGEGHPDAWREHYQGGPIGYRQREFEPAPGQQSRWLAQSVEEGHAVAWNPSFAGGGKTEDTFLVEPEGLRCVTQTGDWPQVEAPGGRLRSAFLEIAR